MPIKRGFDSEGCFYRYGDTGKPYHYKCGDEQARKRAYDKAVQQEQAVISSGGGDNPIKYTTLKKWRNNPLSSNVDKIMYNDESMELVIKFNSGDIYTYENIDFTDFNNIINGRAVCVTEGENRWGTWYVGKTPSVGAAVYKYLVDSGATYKKGGTLK